MNTPIDNPSTRISVMVNGQTLVREVECRKHLVDFLREDCGLKGAHLGCEHGVCGACTVRLDGQIVRGCLVLAAQADGHRGRDRGDTDAEPAPDGAAGRLRRAQRAAMRLLHAGHADGGAGPGGTQTRRQPRAGA